MLPIAVEKLTPKLKLLTNDCGFKNNNTFIVSYHFCGPEIREQLGWAVLTKNLPESDICWSCSHLEA